MSMDSIVVGVIGPYKSGKTSLVNKLQQRKGIEEDVAFYFFKYAGKNVTLVDTPGDMDAPTTVASVISISDACILCISPETKINFQVGEQLILMDNLGIRKGLICITKSDLSTPEDVEQLKENIKKVISTTSLKDMEIVDVNINDEQKIADMRAKIAAIEYDKSKINGPIKLAVDHAFESKGMSIAVGTMMSGRISVHSDGIIVPTPFTKEISINSIQINQEDVQSAEAGDRVGVAIKGVWPWDLPRGVEIREKGKYRDINSGRMKINVNPLYKFDLKDGMKLDMVCNWQTSVIKVSNVKKEGTVIETDFTSEKNFAFDDKDRILIINKDLPIRVLRVVGTASVI